MRFSAEIVDVDGLRVGYAMPQARRDARDGMHLLLRTRLPQATPPSLIERHLRHFAVQFTHWRRPARLEAGQERTAS